MRFFIFFARRTRLLARLIIFLLTLCAAGGNRATAQLVGSLSITSNDLISHAGTPSPPGFSINYNSFGILPPATDAQHTFSIADGGASISAFADAQYGALHAIAVAAADNTQNNTASAQVQATFNDVVQVTSPTLPAGTPVALQLNIHLDYHVTGANQPKQTPPSALVMTDWKLYPTGINVVGTSDTFRFTASENLQATQPSTYSGIYHSAVGEQFAVSAVLAAQAQCGSSPGFTSGLATADALNTSAFTLISITPGAGYTTSSGVTYVPEPASLLSLCLGGLLLIRRRTHTNIL